MANDPSAFGKYLRAKRKAARFSQGELAEKLGVSQSFLSEIERGTRAPLSSQRWPALTAALPGITLHELERSAAMTRPLIIDLGRAAPECADLAVLLAGRIRAGNLSGAEVATLLDLLTCGGATPVRAQGRVVDGAGQPLAGKVFVYRLGSGGGWLGIVGVRGHAGKTAGPLDARVAVLTDKIVNLAVAGDPRGKGFFDVTGGLPPGEYALDVHHDGTQEWAWPLTVSNGDSPQDVRIGGPSPSAPARRTAGRPPRR